jgi:hypothetical protein
MNSKSTYGDSSVIMMAWRRYSQAADGIHRATRGLTKEGEVRIFPVLTASISWAKEAGRRVQMTSVLHDVTSSYCFKRLHCILRPIISIILLLFYCRTCGMLSLPVAWGTSHTAGSCCLSGYLMTLFQLQLLHNDARNMKVVTNDE